MFGDLSVDREWKYFKKQLSLNGYDVFIISLDLSKDYLARLYESKGYFESLKRIDKLVNDHCLFLDNFKNDIALHIKEKDFRRRCQISYKETSKWMKIISKK